MLTFGDIKNKSFIYNQINITYALKSASNLFISSNYTLYLCERYLFIFKSAIRRRDLMLHYFEFERRFWLDLCAGLILERKVLEGSWLIATALDRYWSKLRAVIGSCN